LIFFWDMWRGEFEDRPKAIIREVCGAGGGGRVWGNVRGGSPAPELLHTRCKFQRTVRSMVSFSHPRGFSICPGVQEKEG